MIIVETKARAYSEEVKKRGNAYMRGLVVRSKRARGLNVKW